jgi:hypothetical protein
MAEEVRKLAGVYEVPERGMADGTEGTE